MGTTNKKVTKGQAFFMLILGIALVVVGFMLTDDADAVILLCVGAILSVIAILFKATTYSEIQSTAIALAKNMLMPILIVFAVGMMVGSWVLSGTVPIMVYYGIQIISPSIFYFLTCLICFIMALIMGSSWGTLSTVGIAFLGMSAGLGLSPVITAGAIASGALCGDKCSPMSDSPNVACAVSRCNLFEGCVHGAKTSIPALVICLIYFLILGFGENATGTTATAEYNLIIDNLSTIFNLNPLLLLPPVVVIVLIAMKKPILPTFAAGIVLAGILAFIFQGADLYSWAGAMMNGYTEATGIEIIDEIILRGGLSGFLGVAAILIAACVFGAPLRAAGVIDALLDLITTTSKSPRSMMSKVYAMCLSFFIITGGYDLTYAALGYMLPEVFDKFHVHRKNLARLLQDCTISLSPMIPWGGMGAFYAATLGVRNIDFFFYAPLTWLAPLIGFIYILTGFTITKVTDEEIAAQDAALEI